VTAALVVVAVAAVVSMAVVCVLALRQDKYDPAIDRLLAVLAEERDAAHAREQRFFNAALSKTVAEFATLERIDTKRQENERLARETFRAAFRRDLRDQLGVDPDDVPDVPEGF
jgi:hypothetical protein